MLLAATANTISTTKTRIELMSRQMDDASAPLTGVAILIVEDDPDARRLTAITLEASGGIVVSVANAEDALKALESIVPAVVLTDLDLPRHVRLLRQIRRLPADKGGRVPVVAFSAHVDPRARARVREAGFGDLIGQPIDPAALRAVIAKPLAMPTKLG